MATAVRTLQNFIDGELVDPADGRREPVVNPATGETIAEAPESTEADVDRAVAAARAAFEGWAVTTPGERALALLRLADAIEENADELAELEATNAGKPLDAFRDDEIPFMVDNLRFFAGAARCMEGKPAGRVPRGLHVDDPPRARRRRRPDQPVELPADDGRVEDRPRAGHREHDRAQAGPDDAADDRELAELAAEFLPQGVLNVITGGNDPGAALVTHDDVDMVSLTGSVETGKWIAEHAAQTLKRVHLELGGKAPVVVFDDVALETALETIAGTGYYNAGQDCTAATRVLAGSKVYDDVVGGLAEQASGLVMGDTLSADTTLGPLNSARQRERVEGFLERKPDNAEVVTGGSEPDLPGFFLEPTVVAASAGRRDDPARDLRPGDHGAALLRRGRRRSPGPTGRLRPRLLGLDARRRPGAAGGQGPALRLRVDQRPHPTGLGDAPRRLQAVGLRQGPVDVRPRGLHAGQARDGQA